MCCASSEKLSASQSQEEASAGRVIEIAGMGASLSCFGGSGGGYYADEPGYEQPRRSSRKVRPSDEDGLWYVGERDVDMKASAFIARFHATASS